MKKFIFFTITYQGRPEGGISEHKAPFAHEHAPMKDLGDIVKEIKPTCLVSMTFGFGV